MRTMFVILFALLLLKPKCPAQVYSVNAHSGPISTASGKPVEVSGIMVKIAKIPIAVSTNQAVLFTDASGARALVQFTSFGINEASYRWRYLGPETNVATTGIGKVVESYEHLRRDGTIHWNFKAKADHDPIVKAGAVRIEWSYGSQTNGWVHYEPSREKVELIDWKAFESEPATSEKFMP